MSAGEMRVSRVGPRARAARRRLGAFLEAAPFVTPTVVGLLVFYLGPVVASFVIGFTAWNLFSPPTWIGLHNYQDLVASGVFWIVVRNTFVYVLVTVPASIVLGFLAALLLHREGLSSVVYRSLVFLPVVPSVVAVGILWMWLYQPQFGLVNYLASVVHLPQPGWLSSLGWAMPALIIVSVWRNVGYNMMIFLAGLKGVSRDTTEAAVMDGASYPQTVFRILLPLTSPTFFFAVIVGLINSAQVFDLTYVMTQGGPANTTNTLAYFTYQQGFQHYDFGHASAAAYVLFCVVLVTVGVAFWLERRLVFYQSERG
jgi:multiple sugar transport system permease protein